MSIRTINLIFLCKSLLAANALFALVALPVGQLVPSVSLGLLVLYVAAAITGALALLILVVVCWLQFWQFILRNGSTDPRWFWFSGEPRRLAALRQGKAVHENSREVP